MQQFPGQSASELEMSISSFVLSLLYLGSLGCSLQDVPILLATHDTLPVTFLDSDSLSELHRKGKHKTSTVDQCTWWIPDTKNMAETDGFKS